MTPLIELRGICKTFGNLNANINIDLEIFPGEILALLGENGAGKTTLVNILYGLYRPDSGQIYVKGKRVDFLSPRDAIDHGISMVHQHFMLIPVHTVLENILLASRQIKQVIPDIRSFAKYITEISNKCGLPIDPNAPTGILPLGIQQRVEIVKALCNKTELLILDEPTGVLTPQEVSDLLKVLRKLANEGLAIVFITHKLEEVMAFTDRVVVLRNGCKVGEVSTCKTNAAELASMMVGRNILFNIKRDQKVGSEVVLKVENVSAKNDGGQTALRNLSLELHSGEILGVAGIDGNGQRELAETIIGLRTFEGAIEILGRNIKEISTSEIHRIGVGIIPEDRLTSGLVLDFSVEENLILEQFPWPPLSKFGVLQHKLIRKRAFELIREYSINVSNPEVPARHLSGGNQQKVLLARAFAHQPKLIIACQPTRGLDVSATEFIRQRLINKAKEGGSVLLISTELDEVIMLSNVIVVMFEGQIMGSMTPNELIREQIGLMMAGVKKSDLPNHIY